MACVPAGALRGKGENRPMANELSPSKPDEPASQQIFADRPILSAKDDLLGRAGFAQALAKAIRAWCGDESLTIAVSGDWGSGKTSLKNMVLEYLRGSGLDAPEIVEFNPWKWDTQDKISAAFFREISIALHKVDRSAAGRRRVRRWKRYGRFLTFGSNVVADFSTAMPSLLAAAAFFGLLAYFFPNVSAGKILAPISVAALALAAFLGFGGNFATKLASLISEGLEDDERRSLEDQKNELTEDLKKLKRSVLVVIDDLDRITKSETRSVIQHIKANADFPHLIYLLLYHEELIASHLKEDLITGKEFLEKIVQLPFDIPAISKSRLNQVLFASLDNVFNRIEGLPFDQHRWQNLFAGALSPFFTNLRAINRFLSTFSVHIGLFRGNRAFEVNVVDLTGMEVLRVFEPQVYRQMAVAKSVLTSGARPERGGTPPQLQAIFDAASAQHRDDVKELLKQLFPPIEAALGGATYTVGFHESWREELRVCSEDVFDRYFELGIPEGDLSESQFRELVDATSDYTKFVCEFQAIRTAGLLDAMLSRLVSHAPHLPLQNAEPLTRALMDLGEDLPDPGGFFAITSEFQMLRILVRFLGQEVELRCRGNIVLTAIQQADRLLVPATTISNDQSVRDKGNMSPEGKLFEDDQLEKAKSIWTRRMEEIATIEPERLLNNPKVLFLLYRWKEWTNGDGPDHWIPKIINSRERALDFLASMTQQASIHSSGDHVFRQRSFMRLIDIEKFVTIEQLAQYIDADNLDAVTLSATHARGLATFREALQRRAQGKGDDSFFDH